MTMSTERECLKYRLLGSQEELASWGHEYVRYSCMISKTLIFRMWFIEKSDVLFTRNIFQVLSSFVFPGIWLERSLRNGRRLRKAIKPNRKFCWSSWKRSFRITWAIMPSTRPVTSSWRSNDLTCWNCTSMKTLTLKSAFTWPGQCHAYPQSLLTHIFVFSHCSDLSLSASPAVWVMSPSLRTRLCWNVLSTSSVSSTVTQKPSDWRWCSMMWSWWRTSSLPARTCMTHAHH